MTTAAANLAGKSSPSPLYRPNPNRAIFVHGKIEDSLVEKLAPDILRLQAQSREPITVYIDSPGGSIASAAALLRLLRAPGQDMEQPCRLITVATTRAASAAADLLSSGDYALALPGSLVHFHGVRRLRDTPLTVEEATDAARDLKESNREFAISLARRSCPRFFFRYATLQGEFSDFRNADAKRQKASDFECFVGLLLDRVSSLGVAVLQKAQLRNKRYESLSTKLLSSPVKGRLRDLSEESEQPEVVARVEAEVLKNIINFELASNRKVPQWTFSSSGLAQVNDDFFLISQYISYQKSELIEELSKWGDFVLSQGQIAKIEELPEEQRRQKRRNEIGDALLPVWLFFAALCHGLQERENVLTSEDAFWLGLIDEVYGTDLPCFRRVIEDDPTGDR